MKILCFGDSNTYGYDPRSFFGDRYASEHRWPDTIAREHGYNVVNAGENGRGIPRRPSELHRFDQLLSDEAPFDLLLVMLGTNDLLQGLLPDEAALHMENFLSRIPLEKAKILLIGPPPMTRGTWVASQSQIDASNALNQMYRTLAHRLGIQFADAAAWNIALAFDGVHFTENGHAAFAESLVRYLNQGGL